MRESIRALHWEQAPASAKGRAQRLAQWLTPRGSASPGPEGSGRAVDDAVSPGPVPRLGLVAGRRGQSHAVLLRCGRGVGIALRAANLSSGD